MRPAPLLALLSLLTLLIGACASSSDTETLKWKNVVPGRDTVAYAADGSSSGDSVPQEASNAPGAAEPAPAERNAAASYETGSTAPPADSNGSEPATARIAAPPSGEPDAALPPGENVEIPPALDEPADSEGPTHLPAGTDDGALEDIERRARPLPAEPATAGSAATEPATHLDEKQMVPDPDEPETSDEPAAPAVARDSDTGGTPELRSTPPATPEEILPGVEQPVVAPVESGDFETGEAETWNDSVVARVNGAPILFSELKEYALDQGLPLSGLSIDGMRGEAFRRAMTARVDQTLLVQAANLEDLTADEVDVARRVDAFIAQRIDEAGGRAEFLNRLREAQLNLDSFRSLLIKRETQRQLAAGIVSQRVTISSSELEAFKKQLKEKGAPLKEVQLAQILVACPPGEQETELGDEMFRKALDLAARAGQQPAAFSKILAEVNNDPTGRTRGGLLGWIDPGTLQPAIQDAVEKLHPGEVSPPVTTEAGYHVLFMLESRDARDKLYARKFEEQRNRLINELRAKAQIEIYPVEGAG